MCRRPFRHQLTAWLAALALLWGSLLPVLSHAVVRAPADGQGWVEVCTVSGMAWVKQRIDGADGSVTAAPETNAGHNMPGSPSPTDPCAWCATHSPLAGLPPVAAPPAAPTVFGPQAPAAFWHAPRPLFVWAAAQSRAPPTAA